VFNQQLLLAPLKQNRQSHKKVTLMRKILPFACCGVLGGKSMSFTVTVLCCVYLMPMLKVWETL
jgi:hypothetical protein